MGDYIFFAIGIIIVIISIVMLKKNMSMKSMIELENSQRREMILLENIDLAENIIKELKEISEDTIKTLDDKTNEIYQMVQILDEKMEKHSISIREKEKDHEHFVGVNYKRDMQNMKKEDYTSDHDKDKKKIL